MAGELSSIEMLRTDFISNVSHELKTPLTVIANYSELLKAPSLSEEKRIEAAQTISDASYRLSELVTNILKLSRLENQQIFPEVETFDLGEQLRECILAFERQWDEKGLSIRADLPDGVFLRADRELLTIVWNNLLSNAIKFTEPGGSIRVGLLERDGRLCVTVSDTGIGIPQEIGAHIFEKFYQGDSSHAASGNGLGLALVKRVIEILGGDITVESRISKGTTFVVRLPGSPVLS